MGHDLRVQKTKENIQFHFLRLLECYDFKDITIKLLISECKINRSTFYRNYIDKYDLLNDITKELLRQFQKAIKEHPLFPHVKNKPDFHSYLEPMIDYFERHEKILILLHKSTLPINIFDDMLLIYSQFLSSEIIAYYQVSKTQTKLAEYFSHIIAFNILTTMKWWHLENSKISKEELLNMMITTINSGVLSSLQTHFQ